MLTAFYDEEVISVGEDTLTLAIDFRAIDIMEHLAGENGITPMTEIVAMLFSDPPPLSVCGKVLYALTRRHHDGLSLDVCAGLMFSEHGNRVAMAMYGLIMRAMNLGEPKKEKGKNPRKPRGASKPS